MARTLNPLDNQEVELEENEELVSLSDSGEPEKQEPEKEEEQQLQENSEEEVKEEATSDIPERYKGKSLEEVVRMHQEVEKLVGRQSSEVGELRKSVDLMLKSKLENSLDTKKETEPELDFYDDPRGAVNKAVESSSTVKQMQELLERQQQQEVINKLVSKHPDYKEVSESDNFRNWVTASTVRTELYNRSVNYDFYAADELLSTWNELKGIVEKSKSLDEKDRKLQVKAASTGGKGSGEPMSRKIYKRSELLQKRISDPAWYRDNVAMIDEAYADDRVR